MVYNELYNKRYEKVKDCIEFKNKGPVSTYMGPACAPYHTEGLTIADFMSKPDEGIKHYIDFVNRLNEVAEIDCINSGYLGVIWVALSFIWWSKIKRPGKELAENSLWQVEEKRRMDVSDYDFILENGVKAFTDKLYAEILDMDDLEKFINFTSKSIETNQMYIDAGYPILSQGIVCPPFETLCGGRSMNDFFMDCYKRPDKVKEVQDLMMVDLRKSIENMPSNEKYFIGTWVGGWRGASSMLNQKIWDKLVWPYMKELAMLLIEKGLTPVMHIDSCWDRDIERFLELPKNKIILNTDGSTDLKRARRLLKDHAAFLGDVPSQILAIGSKDDVMDYCKKLIDDVGSEGLFICSGCDAPYNSKFENLAAIYETAKNYK